MMSAEPDHSDSCRSPILVHGLSKHLFASKSWYAIVASVILARWPKPSPNPNTRKAETALNITGAPYYFYVMRTECAFGEAVFFFRERADYTWPNETLGATPFDSGGLWAGRIKLNTRTGPHCKRHVFETYQLPLVLWRERFSKYLEQNYADVNTYICGLPPCCASNPILTDRNNTARAWTWEVRVPNSLVKTSLQLVHGFMPEEHINKFRHWLRSEPSINTADFKAILHWIDTTLCLTSFGTTPWKAATQELLKGWSK